jgi:hypothetical protein
MYELAELSRIKRACIDVFEEEILAFTQNTEDRREIELTDAQIAVLAEKIQLLPEHYKDALMAHLCFRLSVDETRTMLGIDDPKKTFYSAYAILGYTLPLQEGEYIALTSLQKACDIALSAFVSDMKEQAAKEPVMQTGKKPKNPFAKSARKRLFLKALKRVAIFTLVLFLSGVTLLTVSTEARDRFFRWLIIDHEEYSTFSLVSDGVERGSVRIRLDQITFGYIPDDQFEVVEELEFLRTKIRYQNPNGIQISLDITPPGITSNLNTEGVEIENITINGHPAYTWFKLAQTLWCGSRITAYSQSSQS